VSRSSGDWGPTEEGTGWVGSDVQAFLTLYDMYRGVWPNPQYKADPLTVPVDAHSVIAGSLSRERSACRSLCHSTTFRLLTYSASYDTAPSVLPLEATSRTVPIEELTRSSSPASMLIEEALDRRREFEEGEEWLASQSRQTDAMLERIHRGQDNIPF
jgi:hypothetical protein